MPLSAIGRAGLLALLLIVLNASIGTAALVRVNDLVLRADGGFQPQSLPRDRFAPIEFHGHVDITAVGGGKPSPLQRALIDFDHDGRLDVAGLPSCAPEAISQATVEEARRTCRGAIVGTGHVGAMISLPGEVVRGSSELTIFNGPQLPSGPSVVFHARNPVPTTETFAVLAPIETIRGNFRYRVRIEVPPIAGGRGALTHVDFKIGRRFQAGGSVHSYVSARCSDNILQTHGRFNFEDGTVISGQVEKFCRSR